MEGKRCVLCPSSARVWGREQPCCPAAGACREKPICSLKAQQKGEMLEGCLLENGAGEASRLPYLSSAVVRGPRLAGSVPSNSGLDSHGVDGCPSFVGIHLNLWECGGTGSLQESRGPRWVQIHRFLLPDCPRGLHPQQRRGAGSLGQRQRWHSLLPSKEGHVPERQAGSHQF